MNKNNNLQSLTKKYYKYGFKTKIKNESFPKGLTEKIIKYLSKKKKEPLFILNFRLNAYKKWKQMSLPNWSNLNIKSLNFNNIIYYSIPKQNKKLKNIIDPKIIQTFDKLGILQKTINSNKIDVAIDIVFDSVSIITTYREKLAKYGIIFCSISEAIQYYPNLVKKFLGTVISSNDNFFAALNSSIFSDGSFCYIPQNIICPLELSTYFRINNQNSGQFERTLIILEKNSVLNYLEGCTASESKEYQLHAANVELITYKNAKLKYSTIQNWYSGNKNGLGGIYNFVTKRGLALGNLSSISWVQVETGSAITWKYPSCILLGKYTLGEFYSISLTNNYQQVDTGTKMLHIGKYSKSKIIVKGISSDYSKNSYRGLVKIAATALYSRNFSQCDSFLLGSNSLACTYPYLEINNSTSYIEHEAKISKIGEEQLFYLLQRGITLEIAISLLVSGFCNDILLLLPLEYITEANKILSLKISESIL